MNEQEFSFLECVKNIAKDMDCNYFQSWWVNSKDSKYRGVYTTRQVNAMAKKLINYGVLSLDKKRTSTSCGTCYIIN